eukprot:1185048-Prorocentrum_minimum.AAC.3
MDLLFDVLVLCEPLAHIESRYRLHSGAPFPRYMLPVSLRKIKVSKSCWAIGLCRCDLILSSVCSVCLFFCSVSSTLGFFRRSRIDGREAAKRSGSASYT